MKICLLVIAAVSDLVNNKIPNWLTLPALALVLALSVLHDGPLAVQFFLAAILMGIVWWPLWAVKAIGGGDHKLLILAAAMAGLNGVWQVTILTMLFGGTLVVSKIIFSGRQWRHQAVPYGVAIAAAAVVTLFWARA